MNQEAPPVSEILEWLHAKVAEAEKAVKAREQMEATWSGGTEQSWKAVGCKLTKAQRLKEAESHGRIAGKCRREVQMFKTIMAAFKK